MQAQLAIHAARENLAALRNFIRGSLETANLPAGVIDDVVQAVDEAACNIITHGYRGKPGLITVDLARDDAAITVRLTDQAPLFDPTRLPPAEQHVPAERRAAGGMGILLMRTMTDSISYRVNSDGHNELTIQKRCQPSP